MVSLFVDLSLSALILGNLALALAIFRMLVGADLLYGIVEWLAGFVLAFAGVVFRGARADSRHRRHVRLR